MTFDAPTPEVEAVWRTLRQHVEWAEGFWLAWIFTDSPPAARELQTRLADLLAHRGKRLQSLPVHGAESVDEILEALLTGDPTDDGAWIAIDRQDDASKAAWDRLMMRLNERRERLRRHRDGGVIFVAPVAFKPRSRDAAPDMWSMRALALEAEGEQVLLRPGTLMLPFERSAPDASSTNLVLAERALARSRAHGNVAAEAEAHCRIAEAYLERGEAGIARDHALQATTLAPPGMPLGRACWVLGRAEAAQGDFIAAERHLAAAIVQSDGQCPGPWWLELARVQEALRKFPEAFDSAERAVTSSRDGSPEHLPAALALLGKIAQANDRLEVAEASYEELLTLESAKHELAPANVQFTGDLVETMLHLAHTRLALGQSGATLDLAHRALDRLAAARPGAAADDERIQGLTVSARATIGDALFDQSRTTEAVEAYAEAVRLGSTLEAANAAVPPRALFFASLHNNLGVAQATLDEVERAEEQFRLAATLLEPVASEHAHDAEAQIRLSASLANLGHALAQQGKADEASRAFHRALEANRRLESSRPSDPENLRDLAYTSYRAAQLLRDHQPASDAIGLLDQAQQALEKLGGISGLTERDELIRRRIDELRTALSPSEPGEHRD